MSAEEHSSVIRELEELYEAERSAEGVFVPDGPQSGYWEASLRVLAVLKEPNRDPRDFGRETLTGVLEDAFNKRKLNGISGRLGKWIGGLSGMMDDFQAPNAREVVGQIGSTLAVINLKKSAGGRSASRTEVMTRASRDRELIRRQIDALDPHVVLACGKPTVWLALTWLYDLDWNQDWVKEDRDVPGWTSKDGRRYLHLHHPAALGSYPVQEFNRLVRVREEVMSGMPSPTFS